MVEPGNYLVINHSTGKRYRDIQVGQSQNDSTPSTNNNVDKGADFPLTLSGNTISWPDDGWYQVQDERQNHKEICGGGRSCTVSNGVYTVINHTINVRYEGIVVGMDAVYVDFERNLTVYEQGMNQLSEDALLEVNRQYASGTLSKELSQCIQDLHQGEATTTHVDCEGITNTIPGLDTPLQGFEFNSDRCVNAAADSVITHCGLNSSRLGLSGTRSAYYRYSNGPDESRYVLIGNGAQLNGPMASRAYGIGGQAWCLVTSNDGIAWSLLGDSDLSFCAKQLQQTLDEMDLRP